MFVYGKVRNFFLRLKVKVICRFIKKIYSIEILKVWKFGV